MRIPSLTERLTQTQRNMTPGAAGGRTALVAPEPRKLDPPKTLGDGAYEALDPWGTAGDAVDLTPLSVIDTDWHGIFTDSSAATAGTGPEIAFGLGDTTGFLIRSDAQESTVNDWIALWLDPSAGSAILDMQGDYGGRLTVQAADTATVSGDANPGATHPGHFEFLAGTSTTSMALDNEGFEIYGFLEGSGGNPLQLSISGASTLAGMFIRESGVVGNLSWFEGLECSQDPPNPSANHGILFFRDNGAGKTQLCARFSSGGVQVIATQP